jgi:histidinol-phosphate phosphatase family protein
MNKAIFLDRDGVINKLLFNGEKYVSPHNVGELKFLPNIIEPIKKLRANEFKIIMISNQPDVSKGLMTKENLSGITERMTEFLKKGGAELDAIYYCLHKKEENCNCRKPKTELFERAANHFNIDIKKSYIIGDSVKEIEAAKRLGCKTILINELKSDADKIKDFSPTAKFADLGEAAEYIVKTETNEEQ